MLLFALAVAGLSAGAVLVSIQGGRCHLKNDVALRARLKNDVALRARLEDVAVARFLGVGKPNTLARESEASRQAAGAIEVDGVVGTSSGVR